MINLQDLFINFEIIDKIPMNSDHHFSSEMRLVNKVYEILHTLFNKQINRYLSFSIAKWLIIND